MERIRWTDHLRNKEVLGLHRVRVERNILHAIKTRTGDWIGPILHWNFLLKHILERKIEGRIDVTEDEEGVVSKYYINLGILVQEDTGN